MGITRETDPLLLQALETTFNPVILVEVDWPTGIVRVHSGVGDITFQGSVWQGVSEYGSIEIPEENLSVGSPSATLKLSGELDDLLNELDQDPRNSQVGVYFGVTTEPSGSTLIGTPIEMFVGYVDGVDFEFSRNGEQASSSITVTIASGPSPRASASITHTAETQKAKFPLDTAGEKVISANKKVINPNAWPET